MKVYNFRLFPNTISIPRHVRHKLYIFRENGIANRLNVSSLPFSFNLFSNASYIGIETLLRVALLYSPQHFEHLYFLLSYFTLFSSILFLLSNRMNTIIIIFFFSFFQMSSLRLVILFPIPFHRSNTFLLFHSACIIS